MSLKFRLILMNFLQFFVWGSWLLTIGSYWFQNKQWSGAEFGAIFSTMGISSLFMPTLAGIVADRFISTEKLYAVFHLIGAAILCYVPQIEDPTTMFWVLLVNMIFYMPTISLSISLAYTALKRENYDVVKTYPPIRVWGTVGFIAALWTVNLLGFGTSSNQFYLAAGAALMLGLYSFTLPKCPPNRDQGSKSFVDSLGLNAFALFKNRKMAVFFLFAMFLGAALQLTNAYGDTYLLDFEKNPLYAGSFAVEYSQIIMSISQVSETLFILTIPFFLKRFGIKNVMLFSMIAWVLRFGLFAYGDPLDGLWMIILSCVVYGMAFDFFNISGSLFVETQSAPEIRSSAQGLFMMMVNGVGAVIGSVSSGLLIEWYFTNADKTLDWQGIWTTFAIYAGIIAILFALIFKHKHDPNQKLEINH
ncbi:MAG: MFS transporter [Bacteroidetes bacterium]|nr:MAG: MFS transporter [Bacteroidota bacterium]